MRACPKGAIFSQSDLDRLIEMAEYAVMAADAFLDGVHVPSGPPSKEERAAKAQLNRFAKLHAQIVLLRSAS